MHTINTNRMLRDQRMAHARKLAFLAAFASVLLGKPDGSPDADRLDSILYQMEHKDRSTQHVLPLVGALTVIGTDTGTTPSTTRVTMAAGMNSVRIWMDEGIPTETWVSVYVKKNGGATKELQLFRWQARILRMELEEGDTVAFSTANGRDLKVSQMAVPTEWLGFVGDNATVAVDGGLPGVWNPTTPHFTLSANGSSFVIKAGAKAHIFIMEKDDTGQLTPARSVVRSTVKDIHIRCTYRQIFLATRNPSSLDLILPWYTVLSGVSTDMTLDIPAFTGTLWNVTNLTELNAAIAGAVKGDRIRVQDGTYTRASAISAASWVANQAAGNVGMSGIYMYSASDDPTACIIEFSDPAHTFSVTHTSTSDANIATVRGITINREGSAANCGVKGGKWRWQNCRFPGNCSSDSYTNFTAEVNGSTTPIDFIGLDLHAGNTSTDSFNANGNATTNAASSVIYARCSATATGTGTSIQALTCHLGIAVRSYGCSWTKTAATENVTAPDSTSTILLAFDTIVGRIYNCDPYCCFHSPLNAPGVDTAWCVPKNFAFFNHVTTSSTAVTGAAWVLHTNTSPTARTVPIDHNVFTPSATGWRFIRTWVGGFKSFGNISIGASGIGATAMYADIYTGSNTQDTVLWNATSILNGSIFLANNNFKGNVRNIVCTHTSSAIVPNDAATNTAMTGKGYSTLKTQSNSYSLGTSDTVATPAIDEDYLPTRNGNCDRNGDPSVMTAYGKSDPWGLVFKAGEEISRGGRECPALISNATLHPDLFFEPVTVAPEPSGNTSAHPWIPAASFVPGL